jgi:hypothetical protein
MAESWGKGGTFVAAPFFAQGSSAYAATGTDS